MPSQPSKCPECGEQGRWGWDDDWCHDDWHGALHCSREGYSPDASEAQAIATALLSKRQMED